MELLFVTGESIAQFADCLGENEKADLTIRKYVRVVQNFCRYLNGEPVTKAALVAYREQLKMTDQARTVNGKISALNAYVTFMGKPDCRLKFLKVQREVFVDDSRELSEAEYQRLLQAARSRKNRRLYYIMLTICGTGIRVSELPFITVEAVRRGCAEISLKGKCRTVILTKELVKKLQVYVKEQRIVSGIIFRTKTGRPMDRSNICHDMKKLCKIAGVEPEKVFPHNLRHLFARSYYAVEKNLAHLADILGHSSVETTRIYVAAGRGTHERILQKMRLIL